MTSDHIRRGRLTERVPLATPVPLRDGLQQLDAEKSVQSPRGGQPHPALRALTQMGADLVRGVARLVPVDLGRKSCSTVDAPHSPIISHNAQIFRGRGDRRVPARLGVRRTVLAAAAVLALLTGCGPTDGAVERQRGRSDAYLDLSQSPMAAPDHELRTVDGEPWSFTDAAEGHLTLLYFGYTSCPDVCPTTMADITDTLDRMGTAAERVDVVMVSTDPHRDTPEQLRTWLHGFDPGFTGVLGTEDEVVAAAQSYGIPVEPPVRTGDDYLVTHGERVAVLRPGGDAVGFFDPGTSGEQMSSVLSGLLTEEL